MLIGVFKLPRAFIRKINNGDTVERIYQVGLGDDGQAWGLVERFDRGREHARLDRWVRLDAIPFAPDELVTADKW